MKEINGFSMLTTNFFLHRPNLGRTMVRLSVLALLVLSAPSPVHAQPTPPNDPNSAPIDGGLALLIGAGAAAAAWKFRGTRNAAK
jgi:hypothetical protein